jgi:hypothetical protein
MTLTSARGELLRAACLALALVGSGGGAAAETPNVNGSWAGVYENSLDLMGVDQLELIVNADRTVTGTWDGKKIERGEVVGDRLLQWECSRVLFGSNARYCARCSIKGNGKVLVIDYTVTTRGKDGKLEDGYTGTSTLTRKK